MKLEEICKKHGVTLCYLFGSQHEKGRALLEGERLRPEDPESDIDFGVLLRRPPVNALEAYATLSVELQELVDPFRADLLLLHEVDPLIQLEVIRGIVVFCDDEALREAFEEKVLMKAADAYHVFKLNEKDLFEAIDHGYFEFEYENA